ncbi:sortase A [Leucobacter exalbidus]|uniref:Sortase A n=1 Tax=Leucobacter exalbidus TaxID=662960 RepID=A0A940SZL8_9MICO|nr:class C sortase [Leucobacter exalbidus]MBP1325035.1 sortase A [Leucobacter exalbidus]
MTLTVDPKQHDEAQSSVAARGSKWRPSMLSWVIAFVTLIGVIVALYPNTAQWLSAYSQSQLVKAYSTQVEEVTPDASSQMVEAFRYNEALTAGVDLLAGATVPTGTGTSNADYDYNTTLTANEEGLMARIRFPVANVDLPIYHGTSDSILLKGAGHLEGSHLPVGGDGTRSVITAHRGLAEATMFSNLDRVAEGDRFTIETFGEVLTYEIRETRVIAPEDTDSLRAEPERDLVTLVTCTPLGINTHRILVTGERVTPTPPGDLRSLGQESVLPGFPWWMLVAGAALLLVAGFVWRAGYVDTQNQRQAISVPKVDVGVTSENS